MTQDVVIDLVCYRKSGHNEIDEPMFTNPIMYKIVKQHEQCLKKYSRQLIEEGSVSKEWFDAELKKYDTILEDAYVEAKNDAFGKEKYWLDSPWKKFFKGIGPFPYPDTGVSEEILSTVANKYSEAPGDGFNLHKGIKRIIDGHKKMTDSRVADWALGETMAFGSLLMEGTHVRLSGQDVERGMLLWDCVKGYFGKAPLGGFKLNDFFWAKFYLKLVEMVLPVKVVIYVNFEVPNFIFIKIY